ncbi:MAG: OmpH family outer membrane protein [Bacteroidota bacterium]
MQINKQMLIAGLAIISMSVAISFSLNYFFLEKKVAYVRSQELIYQYEGTKEAMAKFNNRKQQWQANADTLTANFQRAVRSYQLEYELLSTSERISAEKRLSAQEKQLGEYTKAIAGKIKQNDDESMQAVLNQINTFVEKYSVENGYDIVMGTTLSGSVLYGDTALDITDEILVELNKNYLGE